jgi:hypothetical protein
MTEWLPANRVKGLFPSPPNQDKQLPLSPLNQPTNLPPGLENSNRSTNDFEIPILHESSSNSQNQNHGPTPKLGRQAKEVALTAGTDALKAFKSSGIQSCRWDENGFRQSWPTTSNDCGNYFRHCF